MEILLAARVSACPRTLEAFRNAYAAPAEAQVNHDLAFVVHAFRELQTPSLPGKTG